MGDCFTPQSTQSTVASVVSDGAKNMSVAQMQVYCSSIRESLPISDADVVGSFTHLPLNTSVSMYFRLPKLFSDPLALIFLRFTML